jgi:hypothetical protein
VTIAAATGERKKQVLICSHDATGVLALREQSPLAPFGFVTGTKFTCPYGIPGSHNSGDSATAATADRGRRVQLIEVGSYV